MKLSSDEIKAMRRIGHQLKPVVTVSGNGLSESVVQEIERALRDHELIKVKLSCEREEKQALTDSLCAQCNCTMIQAIGGIVLVYRPAKKPDPRLSNMLRSFSR